MEFLVQGNYLIPLLVIASCFEDLKISFGFSFRCEPQATRSAGSVCLVFRISTPSSPSCLFTELDLIRKLLLPQKSVMKTTWGVLDPPVGNTRLNVIRLISSLLQTNTSSINEDLMELNSIGVILVRLPPRDNLPMMVYGYTAR